MKRSEFFTILVIWGVMVATSVSLLYWRIQENNRLQDEAICELTEVFIGDPEPVPGPAGERGRVIRAALEVFQDKSHCERFS